jgi:hypothetical protein
MLVLKSTHKIRNALYVLFEERSRDFVENKHCESDEDIIKLWRRYLVRNNCLPFQSGSKKNYVKIKDPICQSSILVPHELVEKILILNSTPPVPSIETLGDLCVQAITREYRIQNHNISVYEAITDKYFLLFHQQYNFDDQSSPKKMYDKASVCLPLDLKIQNIIGNEAITDRATLIFNCSLN